MSIDYFINTNVVHGFLGGHPNYSRNTRSSSMNIYVPYTYLVGWSSIKKYYYGVRFAKDCNPSDLWVKYFTSSKYVKQHRELYGEPDIVQIRKTFDNKVSAILWESKVLSRLNVRHNDKFLNAASIKEHWNLNSGIPHNKNKKMSNEFKCKVSRAMKGKTAWNKGLNNPTSAENGKRSATKQSQTVTGRRMGRDDTGKRFWIYPS